MLMAMVLGGIGGLILGAMADDSTVALGLFAGLAFGVLHARQQRLRVRLDALESRLAHAARVERVDAVAPAVAVAPPPVPGVHELDLPDVAAPWPSALPPARAAAPVEASRPDWTSAPRAPADADAPRTPVDTGAPQPLVALFGRVRRWFGEGNVPVKIGMLVLFAGVAALLKYVSDAGWLRVPVGLRLAAIAAAAVAALGFAWRQRAARRSFALSLQGGAIGVLLLTVFAAYRLYALLPTGLAFALIVGLVAATGLLALVQDALALAVLGLLAGFAAPVLINTGSGDHVVLFAYYAVLNLGVAALAWWRDWPVLNRIGFVFTFAIATLWGVLHYRPALFASTEPFLLLYFGLYLAITLLHARRAGDERAAVDGPLVFGNPLFAFALQAALLADDRHALALSALALGALYGALAFALWRRVPLRLLAQAMLALAVAFTTLAIPLAFSAATTDVLFALEGAGLWWLGLRQRHRLAQVVGLALQGLAALAWWQAEFPGAETIFANARFAGALLIALAGFASAVAARRLAPAGRGAPVTYLWGMAWWLGAGGGEIGRHVSSARQADAVLLLIASTLAFAALARRRLGGHALAWTIVMGLAAAMPAGIAQAIAHTQPFADLGLVAWTVHAAAGLYALHTLRDDARVATLAHVAWVGAWMLALGLLGADLARQAGGGESWRVLLTLLPSLLATALTLLRPRWIGWPLGEVFEARRGGLLACQLGVLALVFVSLCGLPGDDGPLAYLPLLNPLDPSQLAILALVAASGRCLPRMPRGPLLAIGSFVFATVATLRGVHHLAGLAWDGHLLRSNPAQTALTVVWSVLGVTAWVTGSRRGQRLLWGCGALLMALVLAKLLLVDRSHLGNLYGIASFIAYGLLCTVVGYLAPAPPREASTEADASRAPSAAQYSASSHQNSSPHQAE